MSDLPPSPPQPSALQDKFELAEMWVRAAWEDLEDAQQEEREARRETNEMIRVRDELVEVDEEEWIEGGVDPQQANDLLYTVCVMIRSFEDCTRRANDESRVQADRSAWPPSVSDQRVVKSEVAASDIQPIPRKADNCYEGRKAVTCMRDGSLHDKDELTHTVQTTVGSDKEMPKNTQNIIAAADNREQVIGDRDSMVGEFHVQRDYLQEQHGTVGATVGPQTTVREEKEEEGGQIHRSPINGAASAEPGVTPVQVMLDRSCRGSEDWRHDGAHAGISNEVGDMGAGWRGASWCRDREIGESFDGGGRIDSVPWGTTSHQFLIQCE